MIYQYFYGMTCDIMAALESRKLSQLMPFFAKTPVEETLYMVLNKLRRNLGNQIILRNLRLLHKKDGTSYVLYNTTEGALSVIGGAETPGQRAAVCLAHIAAHISCDESPLPLRQKVLRSFLSRSKIAKDPNLQEDLDRIKKHYQI